MQTKPIDRAGYLRIGLYIITTILAVVGLVASEMGRTDLTEIIQQISLTLAAVFGVTASVNVPKAPDQNAVKPGEIVSQIQEVHQDLRQLRERAVEAFPQLPVPEVPEVPPFSSYKGM